MITREPLVGAKRKHSEVKRWVTVLPLKQSLGPHRQALAENPTERRENRASSKDEASLNFVSLRSFPLRFCRTARAVKGQNERPTGALDSPPRPGAEKCALYLKIFACFFLQF